MLVSSHDVFPADVFYHRSCYLKFLIKPVKLSTKNFSRKNKSEDFLDLFNPKKAAGVNLTLLCVFFSKNIFSTERLKPWFCVTFNIIISHNFPENFKVVLKI